MSAIYGRRRGLYNAAALYGGWKMDNVGMAAKFPTQQDLIDKGTELYDAWTTDDTLKQQGWVRKLVDLEYDVIESGLNESVLFACIGLCYYIDSYSLLSYNDVTTKNRTATQTYLGRVNILKNQYIALYSSSVYKKVENILHPKPRATTRDALFKDQSIYKSFLGSQFINRRGRKLQYSHEPGTKGIIPTTTEFWSSLPPAVIARLGKTRAQSRYAGMTKGERRAALAARRADILKKLQMSGSRTNEAVEALLTQRAADMRARLLAAAQAAADAAAQAAAAADSVPGTPAVPGSPLNTADMAAIDAETTPTLEPMEG